MAADDHQVAAGAGALVEFLCAREATVAERGAGREEGERGREDGAAGHTEKELPQPQVPFTLGLPNLKPAPESDST